MIHIKETLELGRKHLGSYHQEGVIAEIEQSVERFRGG